MNKAKVYKLNNASVHKVQQKIESVKQLEEYLKESANGELISRYMTGFPAFGRAARIMFHHIGFELKTIGSSVLARALEVSVSKTMLFASDNNLDFFGTQEYIVSTFIQEISELAKWSISATNADSDKAVWDVSVEPFYAWLERCEANNIKVTLSEILVPETQRIGLYVRLLCYVADDALVGKLVKIA